MSVKIYIDGQEGTTGLKIQERFEGRNDLEIMKISEELRKDPAERARLINSADYVFLCLPDAASIEAVSFIGKDLVPVGRVVEFGLFDVIAPKILHLGSLAKRYDYVLPRNCVGCPNECYLLG